jgi:hypothetical protein
MSDPFYDLFRLIRFPENASSKRFRYRKASTRCVEIHMPH